MHPGPVVVVTSPKNLDEDSTSVEHEVRWSDEDSTSVEHEQFLSMW